MLTTTKEKILHLKYVKPLLSYLRYLSKVIGQLYTCIHDAVSETVIIVSEKQEQYMNIQKHVINKNCERTKLASHTASLYNANKTADVQYLSEASQT